LSHQISYEEKVLLAQLSADSHEAFDTFYHRYFEAVYRNVVKIVDDPHQAEDLVQEVFYSFWKKRKDFKSSDHVAGWLFLASYHKSINQIRLHARERLKNQTAAAIHDEDPGNLASYVKENQLELLEKAIALLPAKRRKVFELCRLQGKSYQEAAAELGISVHTVKDHLSLAGETVRTYLLQHKNDLPVTAFLLMLAAFS
jgi:RNA polymerase sigma-70 factor (ECF subfamily)